MLAVRVTSTSVESSPVRAARTGGAIFREAAARGLALGVRAFAGADLGLALTGRAARDKSQGHVVQIALAHAGGTDSLEQRWSHAMRFVENRTTKLALAQVRKYLLERAR